MTMKRKKPLFRRKRISDDNDRPRKKKKRKREPELSAYGKLKANIWVRVGVLGTLLVILGIVAYMRFMKKDEAADATKAEQLAEDELSKPFRPNEGTQPKKKLNEPFDRRLVGNWTGEAPDKQIVTVNFGADGSFEMKPISQFTLGGNGRGKWQVLKPGAAPNELILNVSDTLLQLLVDSPDLIRVDLSQLTQKEYFNVPLKRVK